MNAHATRRHTAVGNVLELTVVTDAQARIGRKEKGRDKAKLLHSTIQNRIKINQEQSVKF